MLLIGHPPTFAHHDRLQSDHRQAFAEGRYWQEARRCLLLAFLRSSGLASRRDLNYSADRVYGVEPKCSKNGRLTFAKVNRPVASFRFLLAFPWHRLIKAIPHKSLLMR